MKFFVVGIRTIFLLLFMYLILTSNMKLWFALFVLSLIIAMFFGRIYCGYICPMNTLMKPIESISKKLKLQSNNVPKWLNKENNSYVVLIISVLTMVVFKKVFSIDIPILLILLLIALVLTLKFKPEIFHNKICPFGLMQKLFAKKTVFSKEVIFKECVGCKLCENVCPSGAIKVYKTDKKAVINTLYCFQCTNCVSVCPKAAIVYKKR